MNTIKLKYGLEDITARVPGLFPYIEFDENHISMVHPASDSSAGCYGKVVCAITVPSNVNLDADNQHIVIGGDTYTYKSLMQYYYTYKDRFPDNSFIQFMETGIGRFKIADLLPTVPDEWVLVPEYEYYANSGRLYSTYMKMKIMCDKYLEMKEATGEINCELECLLEKYAQMGGDTMLEFYNIRAHEAAELADIYHEYAADGLNLSFNISIVSSNSDLGILNTFLNYFDPDETYGHGDEVIYNDRTYICTVPEGDTHHGPWNAGHFHLISDTDSKGEETVYIPTFSAARYYHRGEFVRRNDYGQVYVCDLPEYAQYSAGETIDIGDVCYIKNGDTYEGYDEIELPHVVVAGEEFYYKYPEIYHGPWSAAIFKPKDLTGVTSSKLTGFRNNTNFIDAGGSICQPEYDVDWLWYYHIGDVGFYETSTDEFNNIELITGQRVPVGQYETKLMAYGDIITNITRDTNNRTITFNYVVGAHLKAKYLCNNVDDDNNPHYCYDEFEYDDTDLHGVYYTETYSYKPGGEIDHLSDENFRKYVTYGDRRIDDVYSKCEFDTNVIGAKMVVNGTPAPYTYINGEFSSKFDKEMDTLCSSTTKLDYLTGIMYSPTVENDVRIRRGNAAAWERHVKLGEIRSFDDLETYANGGFFKLR